MIKQEKVLELQTDGKLTPTEDAERAALNRGWGGDEVWLRLGPHMQQENETFDLQQALQGSSPRGARTR